VKFKVFISTYPFGLYNSKPLEILASNNIEYLTNPLKRKLKPEEVADFAKDCDGIIAGNRDLLPLIKINPNLKNYFSRWNWIRFCSITCL
jgi:D-3-phosphoglycerate dehydrogenase